MELLYVGLYIFFATITCLILLKIDCVLEIGEPLISMSSIFWPIFWVVYLSYRIFKRPCILILKAVDSFTTFIAERM